DDGPNPKTTPIALEILKKNNITATFFINGINYGNLETDPTSIELVKKTFSEGHDIGSHTYYHEDLFKAMEKGTMELNIDKMTNMIYNIIGVKPALFRPPCGNGGYKEKDSKKKKMTDTIQRYLGSHGYNIIMWGADTRDWEYQKDIEKVIKTMNKELQAPHVSPETHSFITLLHDVHPTTVQTILPMVIKYIQKLGYTFVPISDCIGLSPYQEVKLEKEINIQSHLNHHKNNSTSLVPITFPNKEFNLTSSSKTYLLYK
ncbi:carbohydrate esterase family 4 protein, partial [Piromyces sp. E2]